MGVNNPFGDVKKYIVENSRAAHLVEHDNHPRQPDELVRALKAQLETLFSDSASRLLESDSAVTQIGWDDANGRALPGAVAHLV